MTETKYIYNASAEHFADRFEDNSIDLVLTDPPFYGIVAEEWDNQWVNPYQFAEWISQTLSFYKRPLKDTGSIVFFAAMGKHLEHPIFDVVKELELHFTFRQWITWKKRRAYGKSHDYLYCREEILWFSKSADRTGVTFNIPLTDEIRGYEGFGKHKAKSEYKRVSNVWDDIEPVISDIPELFAPSRSCEKPVALMERLVRTHSNIGDLVVDPFAGTGTTGVAAFNLGRTFMGCERDEQTAAIANGRVMGAYKSLCNRTPR